VTIALDQILGLVGKLDDSPGDETPRERFRHFLRENLLDVGQVRDYLEECLRKKDDQYNRAMQDIINHLGVLLGFDVTFGRYRGVPGQIGFDGLWQSELKFSIVIEVKTTETYAIKTSTLMGYINDLISEKKIQENVLGLYVIGQPDTELRQLENSIIAERKINQLRIISADSLLSLAEMMSEYDVNHEDILAILRPSGPNVDQVVNLMARLVARPIEEPPIEKLPIEEEHPSESEELITYWLAPVRSDNKQTAEECIKTLVGEEEIFAYGERTPGRKFLKPGDWICFYATGKGAIGHAKVLSRPEKKPHSKVLDPEKYPWTFRVGEIKLYLDNPNKIDAEMRGKLDAFRGKPLQKAWGWFLYSTRKISENDFKLITRSGRV